MKKTEKKYRNPILLGLIVFFCALFHFSSNAQLREQLYHTNTIPEYYHPAISAKEFLSVYTFHRSQWTGLSSTPTTTGFGVNYALFPNLSTQLYFASDKVQDVTNQNFKLGLTYGLGLNKNLRFSLRFALNSLKQGEGFNSVDPIETDPVLSGINNSAVAADADVSVAYGQNDWLAAISINNLLQSGFNEFGVNNTSVLSVYAENLWGFRLFRRIKLKSFIHYKSELQSVSSGVLEISNLFKLNPKIAIGAGYRIGESVPVIFQYQGLASNIPFIFQYSYDIQTGDLGVYNTGSHEISIRINLKRLGVGNSNNDDLLENDGDERKTKNVRFL